ncbi:hypothetical protein [Streptosporangium sp. NPDC002524]|uniref:hypothetical protein n=1 Tax=Streptosporangium sp. NPDC002524 TaxID=3154537 RepID=UPI0033174A3C
MLFSYTEEDRNYLSVWVPNEESLAYDLAFEEAISLPEYAYSQPTAEPEALYQARGLNVTRQRYGGGWMYQVETTLGMPWPRMADICCFEEMVEAPIVAVYRDGKSIYSKIWAADSPPSGSVR